MNILQVVPYFPPAYAFGGPVKVAYSISKELVKRGHNVTVYTTDAKSPNERLNVPSVMDVDGIEVHYMRNLSLTPIRVSNLFIPPEVAFVSKSELKKFDVIHLHEFTTFQNVAIAHHARKAGVPYVLQTHGSIHISGRRRRKLLFNILFGNEILRNASKIVALSNVEKMHYKYVGLPDNKIVIIPNGLELSDYAHLPPKGSFKKKFGLNKDEKIVLYLGRIHEIKGIDILVRAFANIFHKLDDVRLVIVGPNDGYLAEIKALTKTLQMEAKVLVLGPLYGVAKLEAYVDADVYVLPSRYETFPMTVLEAYACGKPVIASKVGGLKDLVVNGETGLLFDRGNTVQLAKNFLYLLDDARRAEEMGLKGKQFVTENFTIDKVADKLQNLYRVVASCPSSKFTKP